MSIAMTADGLREMNAAKTVYPAGSVASGYSDCYMVIRYAATGNNAAVLGDTGNPNEVTLTWKRTNTAYYVPLTIINNHGFGLPPTGARGTWLLSILGIVGILGMVASAATLLVFVLKKRKNAA